MGVSTDGQICFGILFDEGYQFPWDFEHDDIDDWWICSIHGFRHSFEIYDKYGQYLNGIEPNQERINQYYTEKRDFVATIPELPVCEVNYCSGDYPMFILALKDTCLTARRGYPEEFKPDQLKADAQPLLDFCAKHGIDYDSQPKWYLSSLWM